MEQKYYVRFIQSVKQILEDLDRGYSFSDYSIYETPEDVAEQFGLDLNNPRVEVAEYGDNPGYYAGRNVTAIAPTDPQGSGWGVMLNGLCGFEFDDLAEAFQFAVRARGYNSMYFPMAAILTGWPTYDPRCWDGDTFRPVRLLAIVGFDFSDILSDEEE